MVAIFWEEKSPARFKVGQKTWERLPASEMSYHFLSLPLLSPRPHAPPLLARLSCLFSIYSQHDFLKVQIKWLGLFEKVSEVLLRARRNCTIKQNNLKGRSLPFRMNNRRPSILLIMERAYTSVGVSKNFWWSSYCSCSLSMHQENTDL